MKTLIIVDIQRQYSKFFPPVLVNRILEYATEFDDILIVSNETEETFMLKDPLSDLADELREAHDQESKFRHVEKSYGFLRGWMDLGVDEDVIVSTLKLMIAEDALSSDDLDYDEELADILADHNAHTEIIHIPEDLLEVLNSVNPNCVLVGGGVNECLQEIKLVLEALNKNPVMGPLNCLY
jgi:hypothetical protein